MGHIFLLLDIKEYDMGQYHGVCMLLTFTDAVLPSWFVNKFYYVLPTLALDLYPSVDKADMHLVHHAFCYRSCGFSVAAPKEQCFLC